MVVVVASVVVVEVVVVTSSFSSEKPHTFLATRTFPCREEGRGGPGRRAQAVAAPANTSATGPSRR